MAPHLRFSHTIPTTVVPMCLSGYDIIMITLPHIALFHTCSFSVLVSAATLLSRGGSIQSMSTSSQNFPGSALTCVNTA